MRILLFLSLFLGLFTPLSATPEQDRAVKDSKREVSRSIRELETFSQRTDQALSRLIEHTAYELTARGYRQESQRLLLEYSDFYIHAVHAFYLGVSTNELGDHPPLVEWLADWYDVIEGLLGETLCKQLHIIDIKIFNYGIPVVFRPKGGWTLEDYSDHFGGHMTSAWTFAHHGVAGATAFWVAYVACEAVTYGTGTAFACMSLCNGVEWSVDKFIAPKVAKSVYCRNNPAMAADCSAN